MSQSLVDRYDDRIAGMLSCYDRIVITGTLPGICYADGMTRPAVQLKASIRSRMRRADGSVSRDLTEASGLVP